jgi:hypothetical protein
LQNTGKEKMNKNLSRRDFLKLAGITSTGLVLWACGIQVTKFPKFTNTPLSTPTPQTIKTFVPLVMKDPKYLRDYSEIIGDFKIGSIYNNDIAVNSDDREEYKETLGT